MEGHCETVQRVDTSSWAWRVGGITAVALICTTALIWLARFTASHVRGVSLIQAVNDWRGMVTAIEATTLAIATLGIAWLTFVIYLVLACCVTRLSKRAWARGENALRAISPRIARYTLATAVGVGVSAATLAPAQAAGDADPFDLDLSWAGQSASVTEVSAPPQSIEDVLDRNTDPVAGPSTTEDPKKHSIVVESGDSLWKIAANHLPADATDAEIDREWRRWYEENHAIIGPDPGLILPGTQLIAPPEAGAGH